MLVAVKLSSDRQRLRISTGTIVHAPSLTKNGSGERIAGMYQTRKGQ
jgi:hypothetical protein